MPVLPPRAGRYLPVLAALGGTLYLEPRGYQPAEHDVIRLSPSIVDMADQSGFIAAGPPLDPVKGGPFGVSAVHFAVKVGWRPAPWIASSWLHLLASGRLYAYRAVLPGY